MGGNIFQINGGTTINIYTNLKNVIYVKKVIFGILLHAVAKTENTQQVFSNDSAITCDEIIESYDEETKTIPRIFNENKATFKTQNFYISLVFLLITIALFIAVSIYCYLIKYRGKQIHLLPFHITIITIIDITFFNDIVNIKKFDPNNIKIDDTKSYKIFLFTTLDMWQSKIENTSKLVL